jgi:hypothetical protein
MLSVLALAIALFAGATACDSTAKITPQELLFKELRIVSAYPAIKDSASAQWVRACGDTSGDGVMVNVTLVSTQRAASGAGQDSDSSIIPGDVVNLRVVDGPLDDDIQVNQGTVTLDLDCLEAIPDDNILACQGNTTGAGVPMNSPAVRFQANANIEDDASLKESRDQARTTAHNVMLLIDQSGSMGGLVHLGLTPPGAADCFANQPCTTVMDCGGGSGFTCAETGGFFFCIPTDANLAECDEGMGCTENKCTYTTCKCGETCTCKEDDPGVVNSAVGNQKFGDYGSDYFNVRVTAARSFINDLNPRDRLGVLAFGEEISGEDLIVGCNDTFGNVSEDLERCFGTNRDKVLTAGANSQSDPLSSLPTGSGRSNLWSAVKVSYDFLAAKAADRPRETYHIVVLTDGPDTCAVSDDFGACQTECSSDDHKDILDLVHADLADLKGARIKIHFVQFESRGHQGRDPRQVEVACVTGGHYQFVNSVTGFSSAQTGPFSEALKTALFNVRYSLMGNWHFSGEVPLWKDANTGATPGSMYAVSGVFSIKDGSQLSAPVEAVTTRFDVGEGVGAGDATKWDRRPTLLKPCISAGQCGGNPDDDEPGGCTVVCSTDTRLCPDGADGVDKAHSASCTTPDGKSAACCEGACTIGKCDLCP